MILREKAEARWEEEGGFKIMLSWNGGFPVYLISHADVHRTCRPPPCGNDLLLHSPKSPGDAGR